ncbi:MAG: DUF1893 domain-containing protein [Oscillospiraceae bacterium]|nr:DUF1893 domain-containing protein [Oscillospiraceae bacterium]
MIFSDLDNALKIFKSGDFTCVLCKKDIVIKSNEAGIKPLISLIENKTDCKNFSIADKIVGKAAAHLYILMGISDVYAGVISKPALALLKRNHISVQYEVLTDSIINRKGNDICPMEKAVLNVSDDNSEEAFMKIKEKVKELKSLKQK